MGGGQSKRAKGSETKHGAAQQPDQQQQEEHSAQNTQKETKSTDAASLGVGGGGGEGASALYGHVFVINGDLKCITCDAWVLPTNKTFGLEGWEAVDLPLNKPSKPKDWGLGLGDGGGSRRVARWEGWDRSKPNCPWILLCSVEADEAQAVRDKVCSRERPPQKKVQRAQLRGTSHPNLHTGRWTQSGMSRLLRPSWTRSRLIFKAHPKPRPPRTHGATNLRWDVLSPWCWCLSLGPGRGGLGGALER